MSGKPIETIPELLAHAFVMETEATDRYQDLADQMEVHHNEEVAALFRKLVEIEGRHVAQVEEMSAELELPDLAPWEFRWPEEDSPDGPDIHDVHYLMTPYQAIELALAGERRAAAFYHGVADSAAPGEVRELAARLAAEEDEHVELLEEWLERYAEPEAGWDEDPDPPNLPE